MKKAIEKLYQDRCNVYERQEYIKGNKSTGHRDVIVIENMPCRVSYSNIYANDVTDTVAYKQQAVKLFYSPGNNIKPGSRVEVTRNGYTTLYRASSEPAIYNSHIEINLTLWDVIS